MSHSEQQTTKQLRARLVPIRGDALEVVFFLRRIDHHHGVSDEYLGERLNNEALKFIPIGVGGAIELFQMAEIAYVEIDGPLPELADLEEENAEREQVIFHLINGKRLDGDLVFVMPPEHNRISDVLNCAGTPFLLLVSAGRSYYVNRNAILRAQQV